MQKSLNRPRKGPVGLAPVGVQLVAHAETGYFSIGKSLLTAEGLSRITFTVGIVPMARGSSGRVCNLLHTRKLSNGGLLRILMGVFEKMYRGTLILLQRALYIIKLGEHNGATN
jgi:hypothetical protein